MFPILFRIRKAPVRWHPHRGGSSLRVRLSAAALLYPPAPVLSQTFCLLPTDGCVCVLTSLAVASGLVAVLVGGLLYSQVAQVLRGETYIDSLQRAGGGAVTIGALAQQPAPGAWLRNLREIFGEGPVVAWLLPSRGAPKGSLAARTMALHKSQ